MNAINLFIIFTVTWWLVLFMILPLGVKNHYEDGQDPEDGIEMASPVKHNMVKKAILTTVISAILTVLFYMVMEYDLISVG